MFTRCPKCGHSPQPVDQTLPAACPACGVILAKVAQAQQKEPAAARPEARGRTAGSTPVARAADAPHFCATRVLLHVPTRVQAPGFWVRVATWAAFAAWGMVLIAQDYRTGEIGSSFLHRPLLVFHEAGHVVFGLLGEWLMVLGGSLGQLVMPAILGGALLVKNRDPFGASLGLWLLGVSLLDLAPYMYDALQPQLMLLSGMTGEAGGHDWIFLFSSMGLLQKSQFIGAFVHKLGALTVLLALGWGAWVLRLQHVHLEGVATHGG